jgi:hypothetical protein
MPAMPIKRETIASVGSFSEFDVAVDNMICEVLTGDGVIVMVAAEVALTLRVSNVVEMSWKRVCSQDIYIFGI